ncbi:hypothetical protein PCC9214_04754 [Planktothrix tepida]|uniref:NACHT domain-containing protein n=1 Tax=Planktothrix tepida PCC 9214 TaxID=671072 RepID=A0A1J1LMH9_9CYAN|nr:hypothetical protein [Planktothrix tepida]CAD5981136.1 hypothetical protein PCC9214_04754 [Planktothrix tepida]CUR33744.1 conserved hypothetical protein [Planktothrix tepida PCC 9214]
MAKLASSKIELQNRQKVLLQVQKEVKQYRLQSLHRAVLTHLAQETPPLKMRRIWDVELKVSHQPSVRLTPDTGIIQVFDRLNGRLLILGAPGSGKTTTLIGLTKVLLSRAERDTEEPIPVLLNLLTWKNPQQTLADWILEQLHLKYWIAINQGENWMQQLKILPLLDGLDELPLTKQVQCIQQINQLLNGEIAPLHLVVCANVLSYQKLPERLVLNGAIFLRPLTSLQIQDYLINSRSRELWQNIETDEPLLKLAKVPLYLTIMTLAYEEILMMSWKHLNSFEEQRHYLFNAYIRRQLNQDIYKSEYPQGKAPKSESFRRWLGWLATHLKTDEATEFCVKKIPIHWLNDEGQKQRYKLTLKIILGLIWVMILLIILAGVILRQTPLLIMGMGLGLLFAILLEKSGLKEKIEQFAIRWVLWKDGNIPWNYQRFLKDCSRKLLLQKIGDRYRFIHRLLQEHFAHKI